MKLVIYSAINYSSTDANVDDRGKWIVSPYTRQIVLIHVQLYILA